MRIRVEREKASPGQEGHCSTQSLNRSQEHSIPAWSIQSRVRGHMQLGSPVILRLKVTDRDEPGSAPHSKLVLKWGPLHKSGCTVNPQDHQGGLPDAIFLTPDIGVAVCPTSDNTVALRSPVNTCDMPVMFLQLVHFHLLTPILLIDVHFMVIGVRGDLGMIPVPGMAGD